MKTRFMFNGFFPEESVVCKDNVKKKNGRTGQATGDNMTRFHAG
jgi:hypothetical protein